MKTAIRVALMLSLLALVSACGDDDTTTPTPTPDSGIERDTDNPEPDATVEPDTPDPECEDNVRRCGVSGIEVCVAGTWQELTSCEDGEACEDGACVCVPNCDRRICGSDGCGGDCGACGDAEFCEAGLCEAQPVNCGDDSCVAADGEDCLSCAADCACDAGDVCDETSRACVAECVPDCTDRECGSDGCDGTCGPGCTGTDLCNDGVCGGVCEPDCTDRECGSDGCDGTCGPGCNADETCNTTGTCELTCVPQCDSAECGPDQCGGTCAPGCGVDETCNAGTCEPICAPQCTGLECGPDQCGGQCGPGCGADEVCNASGLCVDVGVGCQCEPDETCVDGICRTEPQLCSEANPLGLCSGGLDCIAGVCIDNGATCSPSNAAGVCPIGEICRAGTCEAIDDALLCDDLNGCTTDTFDAVRNRCVHVPDPAGTCTDGNACTTDVCSAGECVLTAVGGCIEPPLIDPYTTPTNQGDLTLTGSKPAGSAIEIDGQVAVPESPEVTWEVPLNLVPGENVYVVRSNDSGQPSAEVTVTVVYDITPPVTSVSPDGGIFLNGITVTAATDEPAVVYYTTDGRTPNQWSRTFYSAKTFRVFDDTELKFLAHDLAGNWKVAPAEANFEITSDANDWTVGSTLPEALTLAAVTELGGALYVVGGSDGTVPQAGVFQYDIASDAWLDLPALAIARTQAALTTNGGALYVFGGENEGIPLNHVERLTPTGTEWEARRPMPTTRFGLAVAEVGGQIYAFGGQTNGGAVLDVLEVYNPAADTWQAPGLMPRPRYAFSAVVRGDDQIFLVGGEDENGIPIAEVNVYDISDDSWTQAPDLPTPRSFAAAGSMDNIGAVWGNHNGVVVAGGRLAGGVATAVVEELLVNEGVWRQRRPLAQARYGAGAAVVEGDASLDAVEHEVWIVGGQGPDGLTADLSHFTYQLDYVRPMPALPEGRFLHAAVALDEFIYVFGGRNFQETLEGWAFEPETGTYQPMPDLPSEQNALMAVAVDDRVFAIGGANSFGLALPTTLSYDPALGEWTVQNPMGVARNDAATAVLNGEVYVVGGFNNGVLQTVEIYNPIADEWRAGPLLPDARQGAAAVSLDGDIYVIGGLDEVGGQRDTILRLRGGTWTQRSGRIPASYAVAAVTGESRITVFAGESGGAPVNTVYRYDPAADRVMPQWLESTQLLLTLDRQAGAALNGDIYLFGGNASAAPGPSGEVSVAKVGYGCLNGVRDGHEGQGASIADIGAGCGIVDGCEVEINPMAAALAACQAHGFTCQISDVGVVGHRNASFGSNCNTASTWRFYCAQDGRSDEYCLNCQTGVIYGGHSPCACDNETYFSTWCD